MEYYFPLEHPLPPWDINCHTNACHCIGGEFWLFGGASRRGYKNQTDLYFGKAYRDMYGEFFRSGKLSKLTHWSVDDKEMKFNHLTGAGVKLEPMFQSDCNRFDQIDKYLSF